MSANWYNGDWIAGERAIGLRKSPDIPRGDKIPGDRAWGERIFGEDKWGLTINGLKI